MTKQEQDYLDEAYDRMKDDEATEKENLGEFDCESCGAVNSEWDAHWLGDDVAEMKVCLGCYDNAVNMDGGR